MDQTESLSPEALISLRSLIVDPTTSDSTTSSIFEALTCRLQLSRDKVVLRYVLKLLTDLSARRCDLGPRVFESVRSHLLSTDSSRLAAESLAALVSISEGNPSLISALEDIDDEFFLSLCFGQPVSVRMWLLRNAERFYVRSSLLLTAFLGFSKDPYPYVRAEALNGLVALCNSGGCHDSDAIVGCYLRAVELLGDSEYCVRSAGVRAIAGWGRLLIKFETDANGRTCSDSVFIKLCSMVRDMSMEVRVEAFNGLGSIRMVSEDVLLQTLSKKVLRVFKDKKSLEHHFNESSEVTVARAAGAFVHGLEDEFHEVRRSAINSLCSLAKLSVKFSTEALKLLMDMLYDESMAVRLKALETMYHMANSGLLRIQDMHIHAVSLLLLFEPQMALQGASRPPFEFLACINDMGLTTVFLDTLLDSSEKIRYEARKILKVVKLPEMKLLRQTIDGLLKNLGMHPQEERNIFSTLFFIGQNYEKSTAGIIKMVVQEMDADSGWKPDSGARLAALLLLCFSLPLSNKQSLASIPLRVFTHSVTMLGRFSRALSDVVDQNTLLAYLSQCIRLACPSKMGFDDLFFHRYKERTTEKGSTDINSTSGTSFQQNSGELSETSSLIWSKSSPPHHEVRSINLIVAKIKVLWPLVKSGCTYELLRALRACKLELASFSNGSHETASILEFAFEYIGVIKLLARALTPFGLKRKHHLCHDVGESEIALSKLDNKLMKIRCAFTGLSGEDELRVLELVLFSNLLRISRTTMCCQRTTMRRLSSTIARGEFLHRREHIEPSALFAESRKALAVNSDRTGGTCYEFLDLDKLVNCFYLEPITISRSLRHIHAELDVPCNNPDNPVFFIPGLPVAIPLEVTLHNVSSENHLWLRISLGKESTQFVFLDPDLSKDSEVSKFKFPAPVYITPKAASFTLTVSVGIECLFEDACSVQRRGGPKHPLVFICQERKVYLSLFPSLAKAL